MIFMLLIEKLKSYENLHVPQNFYIMNHQTTNFLSFSVLLPNGINEAV